MSGDRARMRAVTGQLSPWGSAVTRLHRFQGEYPDVQFTSPVMGRYGSTPLSSGPAFSRGSLVR